jgi:hypothetical protein
MKYFKIFLSLSLVLILFVFLFLKQKNKELNSNKTYIAKETTTKEADTLKQNIKEEKQDQNKNQITIQNKNNKENCKTIIFTADLSQITKSYNTWNQQNVLHLNEKINSKKICVLNNENEALPFKFIENENVIKLNPLPKKINQIKVQFCLNQKSCKINCEIKKDNFMLALTGNDGTSLDDSNLSETDDQEILDEEHAMYEEVKKIKQKVESKNKTPFKAWIKTKESFECS